MYVYDIGLHMYSVKYTKKQLFALVRITETLKCINGSITILCHIMKRNLYKELFLFLCFLNIRYTKYVHSIHNNMLICVKLTQ